MDDIGNYVEANEASNATSRTKDIIIGIEKDFVEPIQNAISANIIVNCELDSPAD